VETHQPFTIGNGLGNARAERGIIDEVAFYPTNLSAGDISNHYNDGVTGAAGVYVSDVTNDNPLIYLRMDSSAYILPALTAWPILLNYGQTNNVALNSGVYSPGTVPGAVAGASYSNFPAGAMAGNVALLSGVSSYADAGYSPVYNPTGGTAFTISAFFRGNPTDTNRVQSIAGHGTNSWELGLTAGGSLVFNSGANSAAVVATGSGSGDLVSTTNGFDDGNWHHVMAVHQGTTNVLYVDGVANNTNILAVANNTGNTLDVMIGSDPSYTNNPAGWGRQFDGQICEVAFFTNALTAAQVQSLYTSANALPASALILNAQNGSSGQLVLNWNAGVLQTSTDPAGPYADVTNATSPLTLNATNAQEFYRIREAVQ
jgi:prepilin-type processing-associated H-X9-DG protein